jgi:hypothetical protein
MKKSAKIDFLEKSLQKQFYKKKVCKNRLFRKKSAKIDFLEKSLQK